MRPNTVETHLHIGRLHFKTLNFISKITLKNLVGLALTFYQSIYPLLQRIEMLGDSNWSSCRRDTSRIIRSRKVG